MTLHKNSGISTELGDWTGRANWPKVLHCRMRHAPLQLYGWNPGVVCHPDVHEKMSQENKSRWGLLFYSRRMYALCSLNSGCDYKVWKVLSCRSASSWERWEKSVYVQCRIHLWMIKHDSPWWSTMWSQQSFCQLGGMSIPTCTTSLICTVKPTHLQSAPGTSRNISFCLKATDHLPVQDK